MASLKYWVWLSSCRYVGAKTAMELVAHFQSPEQVFFAQREDYEQLKFLNEKMIDSLCSKKLYRAVEIIDRCSDNNWSIMTIEDSIYPQRLKNIYDPPILLYVRGKLPAIDEQVNIAVVGTRKCTPYGVKMAEKIGYDLARNGCTVVSGMARGIDTAAVKGALRAGGSVIGVVGCGLDVIYPAENDKLFEDVASVGAIISEYAPGTKPDGRNFPVRNRILSGISLGVTVIEAPQGSGAIITASHALEQGRDVFVVPGNIDSPASYGSNALLREGATAIMSGRDIANEYKHMFPDRIENYKPESIDMTPSQEKKLIKECVIEPNNDKKTIDKGKTGEYIVNKPLPENLSPEEEAVCLVLKDGSLHIDDIIQQCSLSANDVLATLTMLEISGIVRQDSGKYFTLI